MTTTLPFVRALIGDISTHDMPEYYNGFRMSVSPSAMKATTVLSYIDEYKLSVPVARYHPDVKIIALMLHDPDVESIPDRYRIQEDIVNHVISYNVERYGMYHARIWEWVKRQHGEIKELEYFFHMKPGHGAAKWFDDDMSIEVSLYKTTKPLTVNFSKEDLLNIFVHHKQPAQIDVSVLW